MNSKQKYVYTFMLLVGLTTFVSSTIYSPTVHAAISKDKFVNILCKDIEGPVAAGEKSLSDQCKQKGKKNNKVTLGKKTYKFADWKNEKGADLKAALAAGVTTPKKLKEYNEQKKKEEEESNDDLSDPLAGSDCGGAKTAIIKCDQSNSGNVEDNGIWGLLMLAVNILTAGVGIVAVGGIVYGSILYTTAEDKADQVKKATDIITNVVIGLIAFALMWAVLNFIVPGGVFS